ncbi:unnamed protein product [Caenorhabditis brenneri]
MADFLKNNPIALRHFLLYQFLQSESVETAFNEFSNIVGPDVIKKEEFQFWFKEFEQGKFDDNKEPVTDMRDILRNDKHALRVCILYESIMSKTLQFEILPERIHHLPFSMYKIFCAVVGKDVMVYPEFEFWFFRFLNGEYNLNYERDKKLYELKDMPIDIMRNVVEYLDIVDLLSLEKTSQSLRSFSQNQKVFHSSLTFEADWKSANISFGRGACISYKEQENDCMIEFGNRKKVVPGVSCLKQAFQDFKRILANPNLYLGTLTIWSSCEESKSLGGCIEDALKLTHLLHVEHIHLHAQSMKTLLKILPYLKPGYLTTITIDIDSDEVVIDKVFEMDQWKQAKYFHMRSNRFIGPLRHLYHFKEFNVRYNELSVEDVCEMKEILLKSSNLKNCEIKVYDSIDKDVIRHEFGNAIRESLDTSTYTYHLLIPNSMEHSQTFSVFEIYIDNPVCAMAELLNNNPIALRHCLLYEFLRVKSVGGLENETFSLFAKYNDFCKVIGYDAMKYSEFEFWFYRFLNEVYDLTDKRDEDKKIYELADMPLDTLSGIMKYLDMYDWLALARTSRSFKNFVATQNSFHKKLEIEINLATAEISFDNHWIYTTNRDDDCHRSSGKNCLQKSKLMQGVPFWKQGIEDLASILKLPKHHFEEFSFKMFWYDEPSEDIHIKTEVIDIKPDVTAHTSQFKFLDALESLILFLDIPSLSRIRSKIHQKIIEDGVKLIPNNEILVAMEMCIVKLSNHSVACSVKMEESCSLRDFFCYLKAVILSSKIDGLEEFLTKLKDHIEQLYLQDKRIPVSKVESVLGAMLDFIDI